MREALRIDLGDLGSEKLSLKGFLLPGELDFAGTGILQIGSLQWSGSVGREGRSFRLQGQLEGELELQCVRCLEASRYPVSKEFDLFFEPRDGLTYQEDQEIELKPSETRTSFIVGHELVISEILREQVLLTLPMKPLCSPDCRGLCPVCGTNLNVHACMCVKEKFNPAFEGLREFKKHLEGRSS